MAGTTIRRFDIEVYELPLKKPHTNAVRTVDAVKAVFVYLETEGGLWGVGAASPAEFITGESLEETSSALNELRDYLPGKDLRLMRRWCREIGEGIRPLPAACASLDIALHDLYAKHLGIPLVDLLGRAHADLPTAVSIGIQPLPESVDMALELVSRGFRILKIKAGKSVDRDISVVKRIRESVGAEISIWIDANESYTPADLRKLLRETGQSQIGLIEQPFYRENIQEMLFDVSSEVRNICAADETLHAPEDALRLTAEPHPFQFFNIKLMKCGGIIPALRIAEIAEIAGISLVWGSLPESAVSITAALHAALACPASRYLDLDGSFLLEEDPVEGGFIVDGGRMSLTDQPGLGVTLKHSFWR